MASPFVYTLLPLGEREDTEEVEGGWFQVGRRDRWTLTLRVAALASGGSVTARVEVAPEPDEDEAETLYTFSDQSSTGETTAAHDDDPTPFTVQPWHLWMRAVIAAQTGDASYQVLARAPFLDPSVSADKDLLTQEARSWSDGLTRTVESAEGDVRARLLSDDPDEASWGKLDVRLTSEWAYEAMRRAIANQADHRYRRYRLTQDGSPAALKTMREMDDFAPDALRELNTLRPRTERAWVGR